MSACLFGFNNGTQTSSRPTTNYIPPTSQTWAKNADCINGVAERGTGTKWDAGWSNHITGNLDCITLAAMDAGWVPDAAMSTDKCLLEALKFLFGGSTAPDNTTQAVTVSVAPGDTLTGVYTPPTGATGCSVTTPPTQGTTANLGADYTANAGATGSDSYVITCTNADGTTHTVTVTVNIASGNVTTETVPITVAPGATATVAYTSPVTGGTCTPTTPTQGTTNADGTSYTANAGSTGTDTFTVTCTNGTDVHTVTVNVTIQTTSPWYN